MIAGIYPLFAVLAMAQSGADTGMPYGLPPPFQPKEPAKESTPPSAPASTKTSSRPAAPLPKDETNLPEEEDKSDAATVYSFNPVQSKNELAVGNEYFVKGNFTAAANRFRVATKWNDGNAEAWMRLGEAEEKKSNAKGAREAYQKYLELAPNAKNAGDVRKRLSKIKG